MLDRSVIATPLLALAALVSLAPDAAAQKRSEAQIRADIEFARGLAQRFRYVDLAEELIAELESGRLSAPLAVKVGLAKCDIFAEGARREPDPIKRRALYDKALAAFEEFLDANEFADERPQAERSFVDLSNAYSQVLERDLAELVGEEAEAVRARMAEVLDAAVARTSDLLDSFAPTSELSALEKEEKWRLMLNMGQLRITQAKLSETGTFLFGEADSILEALAFEAGETSGWGLNAYLLTAKSKLAQGDYVDAAAYDEYVITLVIPEDQATRDFQGWDEIPQELKQARWEMVERAIPDLIEAYSREGDLPSAVQWGLKAYNMWKTFGFDLTPRGALAMLALGNALVDAGGWVGGQPARGNLQWFESEEDMKSAGFSNRRESRSAVDLALSLAQDINKDNKGNSLQLYAQALIKRVRDVPGVVLDPAILYEAAEGTYYEKNYPEAISALKSVMAALQNQDEATQREFMPKVLYFLGNSHSRLNRDLEAAMAYREGVTAWRGDPEYDIKNARAYHGSIGRARSASGNDELLTELWLQAEKIRQDVDKDGNNDITWTQAERAWSNKDYAGAREKYKAVEKNSDNYEKAIAKAALCLYKMGDVERAQAEFAAYVDEYVLDPANTPTTDGARRARVAAKAQAVFYLGRIAYTKNDYAEAIRRLEGFEEAFPGQDNYTANALYMVVASYLNQSPPKFDEARAVHRIMMEKIPGEPRTGKAALQIYVRLKEAFDLAVEAEDVAKQDELRPDMAEMISLSNSLEATPAYNNLRAETNLWIELGQWEKVEAAARRTLETYPDEAEKLRKFVLPDLGLALLRQHRVEEAFEVLDTIVPDPDSAEKGQPGAVRNWCQAVCGWLEGQGSKIIEIPGVGGAENFKKATKHWQSLENLAASRHGKWTCEWYSVKTERIYCYYRYGQLDSAHLATAKKQIEFIQSELTPSMQGITEECGGDDTLQQRLKWMEKKLR